MKDLVRSKSQLVPSEDIAGHDVCHAKMGFVLFDEYVCVIRFGDFG